MYSYPARVDAADGRLTGTTGCRDVTTTWSAGRDGTTTWTSDPGSVTFGPLTTGKRACPTGTAAIDRAVLAALSGTVRTSLNKGRLTMTDASGTGLSLVAT